MTNKMNLEIEARWGNTESIRRAAKRRLARMKLEREVEEMMERTRAMR